MDWPRYRTNLSCDNAEYTYDANGNMIKDRNKGILSIAYNTLNLPASINKSGGLRVEYQYDAAGSKRRQVYYTNIEGNLSKTTDFVGNFVYENGVPVYNIYDEGRIVFNADGSCFGEAYIKDHLGNVRVACRLEHGQVKVRQVNSYYPFGMNIKGLSQNSTDTYKPNEYLYNGKMMQDEMGLNWLDYGARFYDPVLGRWHSVDMMSEKNNMSTPYSYVFNNPISYKDLYGLDSSYYNRNGELDKKITSTGENNKIFLATEETTIDKNDPYAMPVPVYDEVGGLIIQKRIEEGTDYTISSFNTVGGGDTDTEGYILEPSGPSTAESGQDQRIPEGIYNIDDYSSKKFPNNFVLHNGDVSKSRAILYHVGNDGSNTSGCNLPGSAKGNGTISGSKVKMNELRNFINSVGTQNVKTIIVNKIPK